MNAKDCCSDTCPICGAGWSSQTTHPPVRGQIRVDRKYSCGRRVRFSFEVKEVAVHAECNVPGQLGGATRFPPRPD